MRGAVEDLLGGAELNGAARVHDHDLVGHVGDDAEVVGDHDDGVAVLLLHRLHELDDLRLDRDVEGRGRLVGDKDVRVAGERHGDHDALAHAAGELVRVVLDALLGVGDADHLEQLDGALARLLLGVAAVKPEALPQLAPDGVDGVQRRHRVLEDHGDVVAADVLHLALAHGEKRLAAVADVTALDLSRGHVDEAHDRQRGDRLARSRLADDAEGLAAVEGVRDAVDCLDHAVLGVEVHLEVVDLEEVRALGNRLVLELDPVVILLACHYASFILTSSASRRPSPRSVKASTVVRIARPGMSMSQGWVAR